MNGEPTPLWQTKKFRVAVVTTIVAAAALTLILQNFDTTEVQFFFWRAEAPLAGLIFTSMLVGAGLQVLIKALLRRRRRIRAENKAAIDEMSRRLEEET